MISRRVVAAVATAAILAGACTQVTGAVQAPRATASPSPAPASRDTSSNCPRSNSAPVIPGGDVGASLPPAIAAIVPQVEAARGLSFRHPVQPRPVSAATMRSLVARAVRLEFPGDLAARRSGAWSTIGVLPHGADLAQALTALTTSQVIGVYDPASSALAFIGDTTPSPLERFTLAHELAHAVDDQHFDLSRTDRLVCHEDRMDAFVALSEGDAVQTSVLWAQQNLTVSELAQIGQEAAEAPQPPPSTPPFLVAMLQFPYLSGQAFVVAIRVRGGEQGLNDAFRHPPASTEQILHPERYPSDAPTRVVVSPLASRLGPGWADLDAQDVGEEWLRLALRLRLGDPVADRAAAGWDGGRYRAFARGARVAVLMETVWDSGSDASEFASAMRSWIGDRDGEVQMRGETVRVLFASDGPTLRRLLAVA
jgi:hypothetical protein